MEVTDFGYGRKGQLLAKEADLPGRLVREAAEAMSHQTPQLEEGRIEEHLSATLDGFMPNPDLIFLLAEATNISSDSEPY